MLVFLGFALGTNKLGESFTNSNNTLGNLVSLCFASGTKYTLGIITTLSLRRLAVEPYGDFCIFLVCEMQGAIFIYISLFFRKKKIKKKKSIGQNLKARDGSKGSHFGQFWPFFTKLAMARKLFGSYKSINWGCSTF